MTSNTLHRFRPIVKFHADRHFIYITACGDEHKEELQSYYKLTEEDMEEITKEWPTKFLIPVDQEELSDPDLIGSFGGHSLKSMMHPTVVEGRRKKRYRS
jgi:hypothetical protein